MKYYHIDIKLRIPFENCFNKTCFVLFTGFYILGHFFDWFLLLKLQFHSLWMSETGYFRNEILRNRTLCWKRIIPIDNLLQVCGEYSSHQKNCPTQKLEITTYINYFILKNIIILGWDSLIRKAKKDSPHAYVLGFLW